MSRREREFDPRETERKWISVFENHRPILIADLFDISTDIVRIRIPEIVRNEPHVAEEVILTHSPYKLHVGCAPLSDPDWVFIGGIYEDVAEVTYEIYLQNILGRKRFQVYNRAFRFMIVSQEDYFDEDGVLYPVTLQPKESFTTAKILWEAHLATPFSD